MEKELKVRLSLVNIWKLRQNIWKAKHKIHGLSYKICPKTEILKLAVAEILAKWSISQLLYKFTVYSLKLSLHQYESLESNPLGVNKSCIFQLHIYEKWHIR